MCKSEWSVLKTHLFQDKNIVLLIIEKNLYRTNHFELNLPSFPVELSLCYLKDENIEGRRKSEPEIPSVIEAHHSLKQCNPGKLPVVITFLLGLSMYETLQSPVCF